MAVNNLPTAWVASWAEDGINVTFPIASIPELTAAEADAATGDFRKCMYAFIENVWQKWLLLASADRPTKMTLVKSASINTSTGLITNTYTFTFVNSIASQEVVSE